MSEHSAAHSVDFAGNEILLGATGEAPSNTVVALRYASREMSTRQASLLIPVMRVRVVTLEARE